MALRNFVARPRVAGNPQLALVRLGARWRGAAPRVKALYARRVEAGRRRYARELEAYHREARFVSPLH